MSQKSKINRARRDARQEEEGKNVVKWIAIVLVALALVSAISVIMMS
mgnify:CR=1 FL=1